MIKIPLDRAARALRVCYFANIPVCFWGTSGIGKSEVVRQSVPKGWKFYDFRVSDKEAPDLGGIPFPIELKDGTRRVMYLMTDQLPFDSDEQCVILFDEGDRTSDMSVQNAMLQLILDRSINGHKLSANARIVMCCNGATDAGTIPLSRAAARRLCHLYIDDKSQSAVKAWQKWAAEYEEVDGYRVSPALQSFSEYKSDIWTQSDGDAGELEEYGSKRPRTMVMADKLYRACKQVKFETQDIVFPLVQGCVGSAVAHEVLAWFKICDEAPTIEEVIASPETAKLPTELGVYFALGMTLARHAKDKPLKTIDALVTYISRWKREQSRFAFTHLLKEEPKASTSRTYQQWEKSAS
jgi:hypothetical protein